jgi:HlyD family secretion protein
MANSSRGSGSLLFVLIIGLGLGGGIGWYLSSGKGGSKTTPAEKTGVTAVQAQIPAIGRLEPKSGSIGVFGPPGDRILALLVEQGKEVKQDQPLFVLASSVDRKYEVELANQQVEDAKKQQELIKLAASSRRKAIEAELAQAEESFTYDKEVQEQKIRALESQEKNVSLKLESLRSISIPPVVEIQETEALQNQAAAELSANRSLLTKLKKVYEASEKVAKKKFEAALDEENEAIARIPLTSALKKVELAKYLLEMTTIKAPISGTIVKVNQYAGSTTASVQPVLMIADTTTMVAIAEVPQANIRKLEDWLQQGSIPVTVSSEALGKVNLTGTLRDASGITRIITRNTMFSPNPREDADRRVFEVRVELDPKSTEIAKKYLGLQPSIFFESPTPNTGSKP